MYFIYVIESETYYTRYVGHTNDLTRRLEEHNLGKSSYTKGRMPWRLVYKETYNSRSEAMKRENFLKSGQGRQFLDAIIDNKDNTEI